MYTCIINKHAISIAEAIHVPFRPQQISKRHNSCKNMKGYEVLCQYKFMSISYKTAEKSPEN